MNLINKKLLTQRIESFEFPTGEKEVLSKALIQNWQKALKDSDLEKTKEKSVQGKFLITFFENILGYSDVTSGLNEWTLIQHPRIENDQQEPDGSLGWFTKDKKYTRAVIELKDARTALDKKQLSRLGKYTPVEQAYLYSTKYEDCNWIIVSNFKEIRLYNKQKTQEYFEKFEILSLHNEAEFRRFYYLLSKTNLISKDKDSAIDLLARNTIEAEQNITEEFYAKYKELRLSLLNHLIKYNPEIEKEILLEKTQKLLDRFVFTLVCEDTSSLLPLNIIKDTYERAINSLSPSEERVWTEFKGLFLAIDKGNSRVKPPINAYNGGLFAFDSILDNLKIKDDMWTGLIELGKYDFESDLNVNILGHIFEQSISDLESIKESLQLTLEEGSYLLTEDGNNIEIGTENRLIEKVGKRKKDGIFYTPEYITQYIIENTVGKYLEEHPDKLDSIKILDPACGSGAFLNKAHSFLIKEHKNRYEDKINEKLEKGESITLFDYNPAEADRGILLNNIYGVDLNQESVDITKLALWLKTARKNQPLQSLDENIKCGNSLIDNPNAEGKSFNWENQFTEIMSNGGFDVIIGNPPYVRNELISAKDKEYFSHKFPNTYTGKSDLYVYFFEQFFNLLKSDGIAGMIVSSKYTKTKYGKQLIDFLQKNCTIIEFIDFKDSNIFEGITAYPSIIIFRKGKQNIATNFANISREIDVSDLHPIIQKYRQAVPQAELFDVIGSWSSSPSTETYALFKKLKQNFPKLEDLGFKPQVGIKTGLNKAFIIGGKFQKFDDPHVKKYILGKEVKRYGKINPERYIIFPYDIKDDKLILTSEENLSSFVKSYLLNYQNELKNRAIIKDGLKTGTKSWYEYQQIKLDFAYDEYIIYPDISNGSNFTIAKTFPYDMTCFGIQSSSRGLLAILNSKLIRAYLESITVKARGGYLRLKSQYINSIPIPTGFDNHLFVEKTENVIYLQENLNSEFKNVTNLLKHEISPSLRLSLASFLDMGTNQFLDLASSYNADLFQKDNLITWFKSKQTDLRNMQNDLSSMDHQVNQEIYKLYKLTEGEINAIESLTK